MTHRSIKRREFLKFTAAGLGAVVMPLSFSSALYGNERAATYEFGKFSLLQPEWILHEDGTFDLILGAIRLLNCRPTIDGQSIFAKNIFTGDSPKGKRIIYELEGNSYVMIDLKKNRNSVSIGAELSSFSRAPYWFCPLGEARIEGADGFFRQGEGTGGPSALLNFDELDKKSVAGRWSEQAWSYDSYLVTALTGSRETLAVGAYDHHQFIHKTTFFNRPHRRGLEDEFSDRESYFLESGFVTENIPLEDNFVKMPDIYLLGGDQPYGTLQQFAWNVSEGLIARKDSQIGYVWSSDEAFGTAFSFDDLKGQLNKTDQLSEEILLDTVLVGDCYCRHGDWLDLNDRWPDNMTDPAREIYRRGYRAGIWIAPFLAERTSRLFRNHPRWFLRDLKDQLVSREMDSGQQRYLLDISHPDVQRYLRKVFHDLRKAGFRFFNIDYLNFGLVDNTRMKLYAYDKSSVQLLQQVLALIREEIGAGSFWLAGHAPYGAMIGWADAMTIGSGKRSDEKFLQDTIQESYSCAYFNGYFWQNESDVLRFHSPKGQEKSSLGSAADYWSVFLGGVVNSSDNLEELTRDELDQWYFCLPKEHLTNPALLPYWGRQAPCRIAVRYYRSEHSWGVLLINDHPGIVEENFKLNDLIGEKTSYVFLWTYRQIVRLGEKQSLLVRLQPGEHRLFFLNRNGKSPEGLSISGVDQKRYHHKHQAVKD